MNNLKIEIEIRNEIYQDDVNDFKPHYDSDLDNITSVFRDICEVLSYQSAIRFNVSGFGQDIWPLDVKTDLLCGVEELGEIIKKISLEDYNFEFDLYEQGVERTLVFSSHAETDKVQVTCSSNSDWKPQPSTLYMYKSEVKKIFYELKFMFCFIAERVCPKLSSHCWFKEWSGESGKEGGVKN